jgi:hypothetical protein
MQQQEKNEYPGTYPPPCVSGRVWGLFTRTPQQKQGEEEDQHLQAQQGKFDPLSKGVFYLIDNNKILQSIQTTHEQHIPSLEQQRPVNPQPFSSGFAWTPSSNGETYHDFDPAVIPMMLDRLVKRTEFRAKQTDFHAYQIETLMKSQDAIQQRVAALEQQLAVRP